MHRKAVSLGLLFGCLLATPAFAQQSNLPKIVKAATESAVQKNATTLIQPKMLRSWRTQALAEAKQGELLFRKLFTRVNQASKAHQLLNMASFRMYNPEYGLIPAMDQFWEELLGDLSIVYGGPVKFVETSHTHISHEIKISPTAHQKRLLQKEARLQYALKRWKEINASVQKTASAEEGSASLQQPAISQFLHKDYTGESAFGKALFLYASGKRDIIQTFTFMPELFPARTQGAEEMASLYREILAWAHGKGKFPFAVEPVAQMLGLDKYAEDGHGALYKNLDSSACHTLRAWGWTDADIRQFIKSYREHATQQYVSRVSLWNKRMAQREAKDNWNAFWRPIVKKESAATNYLLPNQEKGL